MDRKRIRTDCWNKALDSLGYSYVYSKKIEKLNVWLRWTKVLVILIPVLLGGLVSAYYATNPEILKWALAITSPLALGQLVLSAYLSVIGADEKVNEYSTKAAEYSLLNSEFEQLANYPIAEDKEYESKFNILLERERGTSKGNHKVSDKERRMGMRYGLRNYRRDCAGCGKTPVSMTPTDCDVCGNF